MSLLLRAPSWRAGAGGRQCLGLNRGAFAPKALAPPHWEKVRTGSVKNTKVLLSEIEEGPEETPEGFVSGQSRGIGSSASSCRERGGPGPWRAEGTSPK